MSSAVVPEPDFGESILDSPVLDISMPITVDTVTWRDRFPVVPEWHSRTSQGNPTSNSSWHLHSHIGTHVDAPAHHLPGGTTVAGLELPGMVGPARVLDLTDVSDRVRVEDLRTLGIRAGERLLLKTRNSTDGLVTASRFDESYVGIDPAAAAYLVECQIALLGIDYLSVEPFGDGGSRTHTALLGAGILVLEGIVLGHVAAGTYTLVFLPIPLQDAEAAPGRAILLPGKGVRT